MVQVLVFVQMFVFIHWAVRLDKSPQSHCILGFQAKLFRTESSGQSNRACTWAAPGFGCRSVVH